MDDVFTAVEAAAYLKISRRMLDKLDLERSYLGRLPRWQRATLDAYLAKMTRHVGRKATIVKSKRQRRPSTADDWISEARALLSQ